MRYDNILEQLLRQFPELKKDLDDNIYLQDLPHCFFDIVLVPYIIKICKEENTVILIKMGNFLEQMAICSDENVRELLNISVLEPLVLESSVISLLKKYLKKEVIKELIYWQNRYGLL